MALGMANLSPLPFFISSCVGEERITLLGVHHSIYSYFIWKVCRLRLRQLNIRLLNFCVT